MIGPEWLARTMGVQNAVYGVDYQRIRHDIDYRLSMVQGNLFAAMVEIGETANALPLKPWTTGIKSKKYHLSRDKAVVELVDVLHFIANALVALDVSDQELKALYDAKSKINKERQKDGYTG